MEKGSFLTKTKELTIEGWFQLYDSSNEDLIDTILLTRVRKEVPQIPWLLLIHDKSKGVRKLSFVSKDKFWSNKGQVVGETVLEFNKWYHFAIVWKNDIVTGYLNGKQEFSLPRKFTILEKVANHPLFMGAFCGENCGDESSNQPAGFFHGKFDEIRISSKARYLDEFIPMRTPFAVDGSTLALWHFDERTGTIASDASGNGNDGQLIGNARFVER